MLKIDRSDLVDIRAPVPITQNRQPKKVGEIYLSVLYTNESNVTCRSFLALRARSNGAQTLFVHGFCDLSSSDNSLEIHHPCVR